MCDFRPPAVTGLIHLTQSHDAPGEDLQRDRHPEEIGPSQCREAGGGQSAKSTLSCSVHVATSQKTDSTPSCRLIHFKEVPRNLLQAQIYSRTISNVT